MQARVGQGDREAPRAQARGVDAGDADRAFGEQLGLTKDWAYRIVKHVGNYGEVFERNVGANSKLKIQRGLNALWNAKGLQYAPPIR